jgi:formylglycine-generating enzyme
MNREEMVRIPAGSFTMGSVEFYAEEGPLREVEIESFAIDRGPVTVAQFARFIEKTGYLTVAERPPDANDYPDADPTLLVEGSAVFQPTSRPVPLADPSRWWAYVPGANWRHPWGPGTDKHQPPRSPSDVHRLRGRRVLRKVGRQGAAQRSRMGVCSARRPRRRNLRLGR